METFTPRLRFLPLYNEGSRLRIFDSEEGTPLLYFLFGDTGWTEDCKVTPDLGEEQGPSCVPGRCDVEYLYYDMCQ